MGAPGRSGAGDRRPRTTIGGMGLLELLARIRRVAPHFRTILITGATGTGQQLVARALHRLSPAASGSFVVCNASAIVETLFESELFGHVKGAVTGATLDEVGLLESADGGSLFLHEIGDMPLGHAGQAAARVAEPGNPARGVCGDPLSGGPGGGGRQLRPSLAHGGKEVSRGPLLPALDGGDCRGSPGGGKIFRSSSGTFSSAPPLSMASASRA